MSDTKSGLLDSLDRAWARLLEWLDLRSELVAIEIREERDRILRLVGLILAVALSGMMAFLMLNILVLLVFWEQRVTAAAILLGIYTALALTAGGIARWRVRSAPTPFATTIEELRKDRAALRSNRS